MSRREHLLIYHEMIGLSAFFCFFKNYFSLDCYFGELSQRQSHNAMAQNLNNYFLSYYVVHLIIREQDKTYDK